MNSLFNQNASLINIGTRVKCGEKHRGSLAAYFNARSSYSEDTTLYAVVSLDEAYWTEDPNRTYIQMLVVHIGNLEPE